jgi:hypothetical protein
VLDTNILNTMKNIKSQVSPTPTQANTNPGRELPGQQFRDFCIPVADRVCFGVGIFPAVHTQYVSHFGGDL